MCVCDLLWKICRRAQTQGSFVELFGGSFIMNTSVSWCTQASGAKSAAVRWLFTMIILVCRHRIKGNTGNQLFTVLKRGLLESKPAAACHTDNFHNANTQNSSHSSGTVRLYATCFKDINIFKIIMCC